MFVYFLVFVFLVFLVQQRDSVLSNCTVLTLQDVIYKRPRFVCFNYHGSLGDQMFQYAFLLVLRIRYSTEMIIRSNNVLTPVFDIVPQNEFALQFCHCFTKRSQKDTRYDFDYSLLSIDATLEGDFKNFKYFQSQVDEVRSRFRPKKWIRLKVREVLDKMKIDYPSMHNCTLVGVYLGNPVQGVNPQIIDNFMKKSMLFYKNIYSDVYYILVITREMQSYWSKYTFTRLREVAVLTKSSDDIALTLLASVNHSIILSESIAWWGAWLSRGKVVYYQHPHPNNGTDQLTYPDSWVGLS